MWDGLFLLLTLSVVMGAASFLAGLVPLSFGLSQNYARVVSSIGTGLLVGTCLIIIIPEGVETLYKSQEFTGGEAHHGAHPPRQAEDAAGDAAGRAHKSREPHAYIGLSVVLGFILMYLIDEIPKHLARLPSNSTKSRYVSLANLGGGPRPRSPTARVEEGDGLHDDDDDDNAGLDSARSSATTIGLVIHAAADGIALAASSFIAQSSTGFIVFLAIMIHKAPAAFGLTSVLLKQGLTKRQARAHLAVFSLAAPVGAIGTWIMVTILGGGHVEGAEGTEFATGLLLLFSGGTFLYVAMHTMQDGPEGHEHRHASNGFSDASSYAAAAAAAAAATQRGREAGNALDFRDTMLKVVGMLLPLLAQMGHS